MVDEYDRGRRDMLNALLATNPKAAQKRHIINGGSEETFTNHEGKLPFDVVLWVCEVADQLGIQPKDETASTTPDTSIMTDSKEALTAIDQLRLYAHDPETSQIRFKLVPIEPTEAMIEAAEKAWEDKPLSGWGKSVDLTPKETYCAMLAASPVTPEGLSGGTDLICYESRTPQDGVIRLQFYGDRYVLWYHGEIVWKSTP